MPHINLEDAMWSVLVLHISSYEDTSAIPDRCGIYEWEMKADLKSDESVCGNASLNNEQHKKNPT